MYFAWTSFRFAIFAFVITGFGNEIQTEACIDRIVGEDYTGTVSVTNNGITCQAWTEQTPHPHVNFEDHHFPAAGSVSAAKNYCRNFGQGDPFCYTLNPFVKWSFCTLRICNGMFSFIDKFIDLLLAELAINITSSSGFLKCNYCASRNYNGHSKYSLRHLTFYQ